MIRQAISPRLAMRSDWIMAKHPESSASLFPGGSPREARPKGRGESPASHSEHAEVRALRYGRVQRRRKGQPEHIASLHGVNHPIVPQARRCVQGAAFVLICFANRRFESLGLFRSEEHTSELQSLMRPSYTVLCLTKQTKIQH